MFQSETYSVDSSMETHSVKHWGALGQRSGTSLKSKVHSNCSSSLVPSVSPFLRLQRSRVSLQWPGGLTAASSCIWWWACEACGSWWYSWWWGSSRRPGQTRRAAAKSTRWFWSARRQSSHQCSGGGLVSRWREGRWGISNSCVSMTVFCKINEILVTFQQSKAQKPYLS